MKLTCGRKMLLGSLLETETRNWALFYSSKELCLLRSVCARPSRSHLFPRSLRDAALKDPENKDCLIRPYLGQEWGELDEDTKEQLTSLRNFPLYADVYETSTHRPSSYCQDMVLGLAAAHWSAQTNMNDVEFVRFKLIERD